MSIYHESTQVSMSRLLPPTPHGTPATDTRISCAEQRRGHGASTGSWSHCWHRFIRAIFTLLLSFLLHSLHIVQPAAALPCSALQFNKHYSYPLFCKTQGLVSLGQNKAYIKAKLSTPSASNKGLIIIERNPYKMCKDYNQRSMLTNI